MQEMEENAPAKCTAPNISTVEPEVSLLHGRQERKTYLFIYFSSENKM